jgi:hypothetical protein
MLDYLRLLRRRAAFASKMLAFHRLPNSLIYFCSITYSIAARRAAQTDRREKAALLTTESLSSNAPVLFA